MGKLIRIITTDGAVLASAIDSTDMVARAEQIHKTSAVITAAMGRLLTAASLMGSMAKQDNASITLRVHGGGPAGPIIAVSQKDANAKVSVTNTLVELPLNRIGKLDVGRAVGTDGLLSVIRDYGSGEPQTGHCHLVTGEIADDITQYFATSEQIPTVCALGVLVNTDLTPMAAGGLLIQLLPGADDETIEKIERNLKSLPSVSAMVRDGLTPLQMLEKALMGFDLEVIEEAEPVYHCDCSRERVERALISLGVQSLEEMAADEEKTTVTCHFCDNSFTFSQDDLKKLSEKLK